LILRITNKNRAYLPQVTGVFNLTNDITNDERLQDKFAWREKKAKTVILADTYNRIGYFRYADRVKSCACHLFFRVGDGVQVFHETIFCQVRLCPMCQARRSLKVFNQVSKVMDACQAQHPDLQPIFLTLTVKNCSGDKLDETIRHIFDSWRKLIRHRRFNNQIKGWFRALEVTYNKKTNSYHPHIHAILMVEKTYFHPSNKKYIDQPEWRRLWAVSARLDYDPRVDIRKVRKNRSNMSKTVVEVAKYAVKDTDFVGNDKVTKVFTDALYRKRLFAFGGVLHDTAKEINAEKPDDGNLVHIDDAVREDVATVIVRYSWSFGIGDYIRKR